MNYNLNINKMQFYSYKTNDYKQSNGYKNSNKKIEDYYK